MKKRTIGALAKETGVGVETVRFYERKGLIRQPSKTTGFREYDLEAARRIRFVKRTQELGFSLKETQELLELPRGSCSQVRKRSEAKIAEIRSMIQDLKKMQRSLEKISCCCSEGASALARCSVSDCFDAKGGCHA